MTALAVALIVGFWTVRAQAQLLIIGNNSTGPITTYNFATGATVNSFVPTGAVGGRGLVVVGNEVFYTELFGGPNNGPTDIRVAPFNGGAGGADVRTLPNPQPGLAVRDLAFSGGILFALTGAFASPNSSPQVFGLSPTTGAVLTGPVNIGRPATGFSDGFTVLANGNFLINNDDANCTYNQYNPSTGAVIPATTIVVPGGATFCTGVETDGVSLFFQTDFNSFTQTDLSGVLITKHSVASNQVEDISLVQAPAAAPAPVPTLTEWGMIGLVALLVGLGLWGMRRPPMVAA